MMRKTKAKPPNTNKKETKRKKPLREKTLEFTFLRT